MASATPYRFPRLIALTLTQWLAVIFGGLTARALVILYDNSHKVEKQLPDGFLHAGNIVAASSVAVAATGLSAIVALLISALLLVRKRPPTWTRHVLAFLCVFVLAAGIAVTYIAATKKARVTAAPTIPQSIIDKLIAASGQSLSYIDTPVVKAYCYIIWFQFLCAVAATVLEYRAARVAVGPTATQDTSAMSPRSDYSADSKEAPTHTESA